MTTYTQSHVERLACDALTAQGQRAVPADAVSDAVDIYLGKIERDNGRTLDRAALNHQTATQVIDTVVACILGRSGHEAPL